MSHIDDLPPLRDVIEKHGLATKKALGQNFLLDLNLTLKIARVAGPLEGKTVLEIGPGPGGLTRALLAHGAAHVVVIEMDRRCIPALNEIGEAYSGRVTVHEGDALSVDHRAVLAETGAFGDKCKGVHIAANLPYNIATPLFTGWVESQVWPPFWDGMTLMFQKEVAQRICATQGDKAWGRLGVLSDWRCHVDTAFDLSPEAFWPPPKVTSSIVMVQPRQQLLDVDREVLLRVTQAAFGQRRKMLRQSLKSLGGETLLNAAGLVGTKRAEELSTEDFVALANALKTPG
ncbi:MAG: 16S rRNA (adenine(1518)-N(6)/adenine(1519)-N(6))-dimethyltransferase RsmA [Pseudomonadota bacterium]